MFYYTYKIVKNDTQHYYLGRRKFHGKNPLDDGYFGSGTIIKRLVAKYGKDSFTKTIICFYDDIDSLIQAEKYLISEDSLNDPLCLNIALGGGGDWSSINYSQKAKDNFMAAVQSAEYRANMSRIINSDEVKNRIISTIKETTDSIEWKSKHSAIQKEVQNRPEEKLRNSIAQKIAQNTELVRNKKRVGQKNAWLNQEYREKHKAGISNRAIITDGVITKNVKIENLQEYLNQGWIKGRHTRIKNKKKYPFLTMYFGVDTTRVQLNKVREYLNNDWTLSDFCLKRFKALLSSGLYPELSEHGLSVCHDQ
jgi:hypothetical protein